MSLDVQNIKTAIITKLNGVSGLNGVYRQEVDKPTNGQYPYATVTLESWNGEFGDTIRNIRIYKFAVRVYQERVEAAFGATKAERLNDEMVDEILTAFDADTTLSGVVKFVRPLSGDNDYIEREIGDIRVAEFIVEAETVVPSTT